MRLECSCEDWLNGISQLDGLIMFCSTHGLAYSGETFRYCPWCAKELELTDD